MPLETAVWHGTPAESLALLHAVNQYCACKPAPDGNIRCDCPAHRMYLNDQATIDRLVFYLRIRDQIVDAEHTGVCLRHQHANEPASPGLEGLV